MWFGMMAAMMTPAVWPWVAAFHRFGHRTRAWHTAVFAAGYLAAWLAYSVVAAGAQLGLQRAGTLDPMRGLAPVAGAGLLVLAGLYQFAPLKRACLTHCRNPLSYLLARWHDGPMGGFRMGLGHGLYCVGCCWALMATALAVGVMNLWWMAALAGVAFIEQAVPRGDWLRIPLGVALIGAGLYRVL
jgi:predicted metal-binding membrane protein